MVIIGYTINRKLVTNNKNKRTTEIHKERKRKKENNSKNEDKRIIIGEIWDFYVCDRKVTQPQ